MKSYEIYRAFVALSKLMDCSDIPFLCRVEIAKLKKDIQPFAIAYEQSEMDIANKYGDKNDDGSIKIENGIARISNKNFLEQAFKEIQSLRNETVNFEIKQLSFASKDFLNASITANDIECLSPIISFL